MFKRIILLTAITLILSFASCTDNANDTSETVTNPSDSSSSTIESSNSDISSAESSNIEDSNSNSSSVDDSHADNSIENSTSDVPVSTAIINIKEIDDEAAMEYDAITFKDMDIMYCNYNIVFSVNSTITEFKFFSINDEYFMDSATAVTSPLVVDEVLYTLPELTSEKDLMISTYINDVVANRGISFIDAEGETHYFSISCDMTGLPGAESVYLVSMNVQ